jgi:hypothetical protein
MRTVIQTLSASLAAAALSAASVAALLAPAASWAGERVSGSGRSASEARHVGGFETIHLEGSIDLTVRQGDSTSVSATADDNLLPHLETVVEGGAANARLVVRWKRGSNIGTRARARVDVVTPRLVALAGAGSGDLRVDAFSTPTLDLSLAGSGDASLNGLRAEALQISVAGSGDVRAEGQAQRLKVSVAGSGDVRAQGLRADEVSVSVAGSGDVAVHALKTLAVSIAGSGDVVYTGDAQVKRSIVGSGTVRRR